MKIIQSRSFEKRIRRFNKREKRVLDKEIQKILEDPGTGQEKKGDLHGIYVHKFKIQKSQFLLSYRFSGKDLELIMIGPHENYYRDLKTYLKRK